jgi:hypothetical protein
MLFDLEGHTLPEITEVIVRIIGDIAFKLSNLDLIEDYKSEII